MKGRLMRGDSGKVSRTHSRMGQERDQTRASTEGNESEIFDLYDTFMDKLQLNGDNTEVF